MSWKQRAQKAESWKDRAEPAVKAPQAEGEVYGAGEAAAQGLQQGLTFGYAPEIQAKLSAPVLSVINMLTGENYEPESEEDYLKMYRQRDADISRQNPISYNVGQAVGSIGVPLPGAAAAKKAGALGKMGIATLTGAGTGLAYNPHAGETGTSTDFRFGDRLGNAIIGGLLGGSAQGLVGLAQGGMKAVPGAVRVLQEADRAPTLNPNAPKILEAAKELGVEASPGMLYDSTILRGLESSLEQSPSIPGHLVRRQSKKIGEGLQKAAGSLVDDASSLSKFEAGQKLKGGIMADIGERLGPAEMAFDDLRSQTKNIELFPKGAKTDPRKIISRNILKIPEVEAVPNSAWGQEAKQWADAIAGAKTTEQITIIRNAVGQELADASGTKRKVLGQIYDKLTNFEENSIKRGAISSARTKGEGSEIAKEMIGQLRDAKKTYKDVAQDYKGLADVAGIRGTKNPQTFVRSLDKMKSEELLKRLSNTDDVRLLTTLKDKFPEQFNVVRQKKLAEIVDKSMNKDKVDIGRFLRATKSLSPEAKSLLFGSPEAVSKYEAIRQVFEAFPEKMGPSGTPQGLQFQSLLNPAMQAQEMARYKLYQFMQTPEGQARIRYILNNLDRINPAAIRGAGLLQSVDPTKTARAIEGARQ